MLDKTHIAQSFSEAAQHYNQYAFLQREIGTRLAERLQYIQLSPELVCDLGTGTGHSLSALTRRFPESHIMGLDIAPGMIAQANNAHPDCSFVCNDALKLALANNTIDCIFSNLTLQWILDTKRLFAEVQRTLKPGGLFLFTTFGPDTLKELRTAWAGIDENPHTTDFIDMHHLGDALLKLGFDDPVLDCETITVHYPDIQGLMRDLKGLGAQNQHQKRRRSLIGRSSWQSMLAHSKTLHTAEGFPTTFEVIYGLAWATNKTNMPSPLDVTYKS